MPNHSLTIGPYTHQSAVFHWLIELDTVDSTNAWARRAIQSGRVCKPGVVMAQYQSAGRGRRANQWESSWGTDVLLSMVIHPRCDRSAWSAIPVIMGMIAARVWAAHAPETTRVQVKWPNDIMANNRKCGGILAESIPSSDVLVVGVGLNVNHMPSQTDRTSLRNEWGQARDRYAVAVALIQEVESHIMDVTHGRLDPSEWASQAAYRGAWVSVCAHSDPAADPTQGILTGITNRGHLILTDSQNRSITVVNGHTIRPINR